MPDTILYVDDDASNALVFAATLSGRFDVLTAASGHDALDLLHHNGFTSYEWYELVVPRPCSHQSLDG